jgi:hypothetical protein
VALVRPDVSEESITSIIRKRRIGNVGTMIAFNYQSKHAAILHPDDGGDSFL